jgi:RNA polymerase sigma factor (sigma-70 family)
MVEDALLIARVLRHDDRVAFGELVHRHQGAVRGFLRRMQGASGDFADDLAQETFLKAHRSLADFRGAGSFRAWLCSIAANELRAEWRRRRRRAQFMEEELPDESAAAVDGGGESECADRELAAALAKLPEAQRASLALCFEHGLTHEEAAAVLQCPVGTLKSHVARGKLRLRALLEPGGADVQARK